MFRRRQPLFFSVLYQESKHKFVFTDVYVKGKSLAVSLDFTLRCCLVSMVIGMAIGVWL